MELTVGSARFVGICMAKKAADPVELPLAVHNLRERCIIMLGIRMKVCALFLRRYRLSEKPLQNGLWKHLHFKRRGLDVSTESGSDAAASPAHTK